jgi:hypothetical protein
MGRRCKVGVKARQHRDERASSLSIAFASPSLFARRVIDVRGEVSVSTSSLFRIDFVTCLRQSTSN